LYGEFGKEMELNESLVDGIKLLLLPLYLY
jgi:hypothetical protein